MNKKPTQNQNTPETITVLGCPPADGGTIAVLDCPPADGGNGAC